MSPIINVDTSEGVDYNAPIEPGVYDAKVLAVPEHTATTGRAGVMPEFEIMVNGTARKRKQWIATSGEQAFPLGQLLRACHFDAEAESVGKKGGAQVNTDILVNQELKVQIGKRFDPNTQSPRDTIVAFLKK